MATRKKPNAAAEEAASLREQMAAMQARLAELEAAQGRPSTTLQTGGGSVVRGSVRLANGHFIGRDFIPIIRKLVVAGESAEHAQLALASYLDTLARSLAGLKIGEIDAGADPTRQEPLELPDIYVPLNTTFSVPVGVSLIDAALCDDPGELSMLAQQGAKKGRRRPRPDATEFKPASALDALAAFDKLTLLGPPGSGKSTFGAHVLLALAQAWQGKVPIEKSLGKAWKSRRLLPVRVVLRRFAEQHASGDKVPTAGDLWQFIGADLQQAGWGAAAAAQQAVQSIARSQGALVLLDGLDECGDAKRRGRVLQAVQAFVDSAGPNSRFLVTARPYAYPQGPRAQAGIFELAELEEDQIGRFIRQWYDSLVKRGWRVAGSSIELKRQDLLGAYQRPDLLPMARNPLLLTLMATLHSNRGHLPRDRAKLYAESVDLLLQRWNRDVGAEAALLKTLDDPRLTLNSFEPHLDRLAFEVHQANAGREGLADIPELKLVQAFARQVGNSMDKARAVVEFMHRRAGLLISQREGDIGEGVFTFPHRSFQEFLAARHLQGRVDMGSICRQLAEQAPEHWREVLRLLARMSGAEIGAHLSDTLIRGSEPAPGRRGSPQFAPGWPQVHLAALMLAEIDAEQLRDGGTAEQTLGRVQRWLVAGLPLHPAQGGAPARLRVSMGEVLGALGDPRFDAQRLHLPANDPLLGFVRWAASPGCMMARHNVTTDQWRSFVQATGFEPGDPDSLRGLGNAPASWVSYEEACAYARWLAEALLTHPLLADTEPARLVREQGWSVGLPSSEEWEQWARAGLKQALFPWGDNFDAERANTWEGGVRHLAPVGCYPPNDLGLHDMAGNLWQWTAREEPEVASKVLVCGGSYGNEADSARRDARIGLAPGSRYNDLGFRVVLRSSPVL